MDRGRSELGSRLPVSSGASKARGDEPVNRLPRGPMHKLTKDDLK